MLRRLVTAVVVAAALALGTASATSLGAFTSPVSTGYADDVAPCAYTSATVLDGVLDLVVTPPLPGSAIRTVELTGLVGECAGYVPIVVVEGLDLLAGGGPNEVLFVIDDLGALGPGAAGTVNVAVGTPIALGDGLTSVFWIPTNVRVGFCPAGASCT